jgi:hypothetical protein
VYIENWAQDDAPFLFSFDDYIFMVSLPIYKGKSMKRLDYDLNIYRPLLFLAQNFIRTMKAGNCLVHSLSLELERSIGPKSRPRILTTVNFLSNQFRRSFQVYNADKASFIMISFSKEEEEQIILCVNSLIYSERDAFLFSLTSN